MFNTGNPLESKFNRDKCECGMCFHRFTDEELLNKPTVRCNSKNQLHILFKGVCPQCCYDSVFSFYVHVADKVTSYVGLDYMQQRPACYHIQKSKW